MKIDPVRRLAHDILITVAEGGSLDQALAGGQGRTPDPRDRAFLAELVRGSLQWQGRYDHLVSCFVSKKPPVDAPTRTLLHLSLHQMLGMDNVPPYAAIHQAGELCRRSPGPRKVAFINGLLQNIRRAVFGEGDGRRLDAAGREAALRPHFEKPGADRAAMVAAWHSHPLWLVRKWGAHFGWEETESICAWNNLPVPLVFHVLAPFDPAAAIGQLAAAGCECTAGPGARALTADQRVTREVLDDVLGRFPWLIVQDPAVQEATAWLAEGLSAANGPVLDMCAAPGGKTAFLGSVLGDGGRLTAMDRRPDRIRLLTSTLKRIEMDTVDVVLAEGDRAPFVEGSFAAVLLDGPCSGTGVLRHHPEGRWNLKKNVPRRKGDVLGRLADRAADLLMPGGLLMYATCSLEPEENEAVVDGLLDRRDDLDTAPDAAGNWRRTWLPGRSPGDGFFAARIRRKG